MNRHNESVESVYFEDTVMFQEWLEANDLHWPWNQINQEIIMAKYQREPMETKWEMDGAHCD